MCMFGRLRPTQATTHSRETAEQIDENPFDLLSLSDTHSGTEIQSGGDCWFQNSGHEAVKVSILKGPTNKTPTVAATHKDTAACFCQKLQPSTGKNSPGTESFLKTILTKPKISCIRSD